MLAVCNDNFYLRFSLSREHKFQTYVPNPGFTVLYTLLDKISTQIIFNILRDEVLLEKIAIFTLKNPNYSKTFSL